MYTAREIAYFEEAFPCYDSGTESLAFFTHLINPWPERETEDEVDSNNDNLEMIAQSLERKTKKMKKEQKHFNRVLRQREPSHYRDYLWNVSALLLGKHNTGVEEFCHLLYSLSDFNQFSRKEGYECTDGFWRNKGEIDSKALRELFALINKAKGKKPEKDHTWKEYVNRLHQKIYSPQQESTGKQGGGIFVMSRLALRDELEEEISRAVSILDCWTHHGYLNLGQALKMPQVIGTIPSAEFPQWEKTAQKILKEREFRKEAYPIYLTYHAESQELENNRYSRFRVFLLGDLMRRDGLSLEEQRGVLELSALTSNGYFDSHVACDKFLSLDTELLRRRLLRWPGLDHAEDYDDFNVSVEYMQRLKTDRTFRERISSIMPALLEESIKLDEWDCRGFTAKYDEKEKLESGIRERILQLRPDLKSTSKQKEPEPRTVSSIMDSGLFRRFNYEFCRSEFDNLTYGVLGLYEESYNGYLDADMVIRMITLPVDSRLNKGTVEMCQGLGKQLMENVAYREEVCDLYRQCQDLLFPKE
ncbi:MAG: hypothetical protein WCV90_02905 [Candidatus Woesearchaeota archaeon]|jgi:hypothetical protein